MASVQEAVSRLTVETVYTTSGADQSTAQAKQLDSAQTNLIASSGKLETATGRMAVALASTQRALQLTAQSSQQLVSENDNVSQSMRAANDNVKSAGQSILDAGSSVLSTVGHLKVLALAAYAISPSFRAIANSGLATGITALGPAAVSAGGAIISALTPALAFLARIALPITVAVAAWKLLSAAFSQGADLLDKYGNAQRALVSGVDDNLAKLTKFQDGNLSAEQVQNATELGARLSAAKKTISDFFQVQLDLNDAGLKMQALWVRIVELIAAAVDKLNSVPPWAVSMMLGAATGAAVGSVVPGIGTVIGGVAGSVAGLATNLTSGGGSATSNPQVSADALAIARQRLAAGMGSQSNFSNRFGQGINDLATVKNTKPDEDAAKTRTEFDRLIDSTNRASAATEANAQTVDKSAGEQAKLRTEFRLTEAAQQDIAKNGGNIEDYYDRIQKAAQRAGDAAQAVERARVNSTISFGSKTAFLTSEDVQIATQLKGLYGNDIPAAMASSEAAALRMNNAMSSTSQQISGGLTTALVDVSMGTKTAGQAFRDFSLMAIRAIQEMIIKLLVVGPLMRSLQSGLGGGAGLLGFLGLGGGAASGGGAAAGAGGTGFSLTSMGGLWANGGAFDHGYPIQAFASGGIVSSPTLFPMANGAGLMGEAGPEAIMPLKRGSDGKLGVSGGGGNQTVVTQNFYVSGVTGEELSQKTQAAATGALKQAIGYTDASVKNYDRNILPARIPEIQDRQL